MTESRGAGIVLAEVPRGGGGPSHCCCCGERHRAKKTAMLLCAGGSFLGEICPDCVLRGPKASAARLRAIAGRSGGGGRLFRGAVGKRSLESFRRLLAERIAALESLDTFALEARRAAVRETREKR